MGEGVTIQALDLANAMRCRVADCINDPPPSVPSRPSLLSRYFEDPFLYTDARGHFHIIYHTYGTLQQPNTTSANATCARPSVSAHVYSEDGFDWHVGWTPPYTSQVKFDDGETQVLATRERPKLFFSRAADGELQMTHLITGASGVDVCSNQQRGPCLDCKYLFWTHTLIVPLDV